MQQRRVVITGIGAITPLGLTMEETWAGLLAGRSGAGLITHFDPSQHKTKIACEVNGFDPLNYMEKADAKRADLFAQYGIAAAKQALEDSGIDLDKVDRDRFGVISASGIGGIDTFEKQHTILMEKGPRRVSPLFIPMMISDILPGLISMRWQLRGPNYGVVSACASSSHAIGNAFKAIQSGQADQVLTGGAEATVTPICIAGFSSLQAVSTRNDEPERASRPFDSDRDGFVMGEGSGFMLLETLENARARDAHIYGEVAGIGYSADAYNMVAPAPDGKGAILAMRAALADGNLEPQQIGHINTHGTATPVGDTVEIIAIKEVFGDHAPQIAINSTKSMMGHLLGAAGAVELITATLAMYHGKVPPTTNLENQDPECDLPIVTEVVERDLTAALSNTFGFGGHNASVIVKKTEI
jgi:3-oxoacyl-[acyl-carrier-protein] synthase II